MNIATFGAFATAIATLPVLAASRDDPAVQGTDISTSDTDPGLTVDLEYDVDGSSKLGFTSRSARFKSLVGDDGSSMLLGGDSDPAVHQRTVRPRVAK